MRVLAAAGGLVLGFEERALLECDDAHAYIRTLPRFETAAPKYAFLNRLLAVGAGEITAEGPRHVLEEIL